jgi:hypothetical protein
MTGPTRLRAPIGLKLTEQDEAAAFALLCEAIVELKPAPGDWRELAWALAAKVVQDRKPKKRGPKERWPPEKGFLLVSVVDKELERRGQKSDEGKALWDIAAALERDPFWASHTATRLRSAYYDSIP